jgi:aminoglycoside phosphotransferase (APT) family kinase protein
MMLWLVSCSLLSIWCHSLTHITAHKAAYKASILHHDISAGNILIANKGGISSSILIDWDLFKAFNPENKHTVACQYTCTIRILYETA